MSALFVAHVLGPTAQPSFGFCSGALQSSRYTTDHVRRVYGGLLPSDHEQISHTHLLPGHVSASWSEKPAPNWSFDRTASAPTAHPHTAHGALGERVG